MRMSSPKSNLTEPGPARTNASSLRNSVALVVVTIGLLGALVAALNPSDPHLTPAPLRAVPSVCPKGAAEFTPSNLTEIPDLPLDASKQGERNRALLRLNMEPCSCGCAQSLAACRVSYPSCATSKGEVKRVVAEENGMDHRE